MAITTTSEANPDGSHWNLYNDGSGGFIVITITNQAYVSHHRVRVAPFGASATNAYNTVGTGQEGLIDDTAANIVNEIAGLYPTTATLSPSAIYQVLSDGSGVQPYAYAFSSGLTIAGTNASGTLWPNYMVFTMVARGVDGSRWRLALPGTVNGTYTPMGRGNYLTLPSGGQHLMNYLLGAENGPSVTKLTQVVTHSGAKLTAPMFYIGAMNKKLRRRFGVA